MTALIYGPDGQPLVTTDRDTTEYALAKHATLAAGGDIRKLDEAFAQVSKRVRNQATSLTMVWDPKRGKPKPTPVTYTTLRMMAARNEWVRAIIKTRKNQIGQTKWSVVPKDEDDGSPSTQRMCDAMTKLLKHPSMRGSRPSSRSFRQFIAEVLEDILALDAGCIEKERNRNGFVVAMYPVDGASIRPNLDDRGGYPDDAYVQLVDGQVTARFGMEDLIYIMDNPLTDIRFAGYGYSPLEHLIVSVTAELYASKYNADYFTKGSVPEGLLNLGEDCAPEDIDAFRLYWMNEIMGKPWAIPIVGGKGVEWSQWRASNRDMQYQEYQGWLLKKMCAVFQIPPQELGELEDVNRTTATEQSETNKSKSLEPILSLISDYFETEVIGEHGQGWGDYVEFRWDTEDEDERLINEKFALLVTNGAATRNEWREAVNMEPADDEGLDMYLTPGQLTPLPQEADLDALSPQGQQDQQMDQMKLRMQSLGAGGMGLGQADGKGAAARKPPAKPALPSAKPPSVGKTDRNPAMTAREDDLAGVFDEATGDLLAGLGAILKVPLTAEDLELIA